MTNFDILIIGSGPSGVQAAWQALQDGKRVGLIDIGYKDEAPGIPERSWSELQKLPKEERKRIFYYRSNTMRAGVHLTPPREHMIERMEEHFPLRSENFFALQATSQGGLGTSWGANAFVLSNEELSKIGITAEELRPYYRVVSEDIGLSGGGEDIASISEGVTVQPPLPIDSNAAEILRSYKRNRNWFLERGFIMGQSLLAVLSKPLKGRKANPLYDMDFWSDFGGSVYRPRFTLEEITLSSEFSKNFSYLTGRRALHFVETEEDVAVTVQYISDGKEEIIHGKKLLLCAGALGSARLYLTSRNDHETKLPLLCNRNIWIGALNLKMLGHHANDARYSLAQLTALYDGVIAQFYSYRSLLLERLAQDIPLPHFISLFLLRLIQNMLTMINVHYDDVPNEKRFVRLAQDNVLEVGAEFSREEEKQARTIEKKLISFLWKLGVMPLRIQRPSHGASIHYAGTLPFCDKNGKLHGTKNVYVADGSSWKYLPAKGLTLTLMANARRIAHLAIEEL